MHMSERSGSGPCRATGATVFGGFYSTTSLPGADRPSVRVVFPLPNGSITVLLRPEATPRGGLLLTSPSGDFGDEGRLVAP